MSQEQLSKPTSLEELVKNYPPATDTSAQEVRDAAAQHISPFFVVLDDDPTGTQSVSDLPVLTAWEEEDFIWALQSGADAVYVMTNSRSLDPEPARRVNQEVVAAAWNAGEKLGREVAFVSRSDSTLRGHFPLETDTIAEEMEKRGGKVDGVLVVPAFADAGRITVNNVHYAGSIADGFVPVGHTEFAKDATFGYRHSDLTKWVAEKSQDRFPASKVVTLSLDELRQIPSGNTSVLEKLTSVNDRQPIICDIVTETDLRLLALALIAAEAHGKRFIYRVGPPFMRARLGQEVKAPLTVAQIADTRAERNQQSQASVDGGLIVVGSHVGLTTRQLDKLEARMDITRITIDVSEIVSESTASKHLQAVIKETCQALKNGNVVVSTSRTLVKGKDKDDSLRIARLVSEAVVEVVQGVIAHVTPRFVVAKGGITSSDVASKGLAMRHAWVVGPMLPGIVSLWSAQDGPSVGIPYIIFAGNVGDDDSLAQVVEKLTV